jgi:DNA-directed RNA polymerase subunit RPC12/RpoP
MYECLDCGNKEKFYADALVTRVAIIDENGNFEGWDTSNANDYSKPESYNETGYKWCVECDSNRIVDLCPYKDLLECQNICTYQEWVDNEHRYCEFNELEGYKCPECGERSLIPNEEWTYECEKCGFEEKIIFTRKREGYEHINMLLNMKK